MWKMKVGLFIILGFAITLADDSQDLQQFAVGSNQFTAGVYKQLVKSEPGSFMVCPLSVDILLALFHAGAKGKTAQEISEGLHLPNDSSKIDATFNNVVSKLRSTKDYELTSANKVYINNGFPISDQFRNTAVNVFDAEIQNLDFGNNQQAANEINFWVETKTNKKIKDLVNPNDFINKPVSVLVNAMYFRGKWEKQFRAGATKKRPFHVNLNKETQVQMMELADSYNSYENPELNAKFLEMPYEGEDISMTFVLPNEIDGLSKLEANIDAVLATPPYQHGRAHVVIPKFKLETSIQFVPILANLGIQEPFSKDADFTGFGANKEALTISKIIQKTFIEVEEEGTTAAAGTAGFLIPLSSFYTTPPVLEFVADHPFIYYIKIKGIVVFVGRYSGP